jgi:hypothetical protein
MESLTSYLHFERTHIGSPSVTTIHSKPARLERERERDYLVICHWAAGNEDSDALSSDTSSASHPLPMLMPTSRQHKKSEESVACRPPCHDDRTPGGRAPRPSPGCPLQPELPVLAGLDQRRAEAGGGEACRATRLGLSSFTWKSQTQTFEYK